MAITGSVFAHDCNLVGSGEFNQTLQRYTTLNYQKALPTSGLNQVLMNLKAYCCSKPDLLTCTQTEKDNLPKFYPESAYLFDHLLDVSMRRLDGVTWLAYGLSPDPTAVERRIKANEIADSASGTPPAKEIEKIYKEYWIGHTENKLAEVMANYDKIAIVSLTDKYNMLCEEIKDIYEKLQKEKGNITNVGRYNQKNSFFGKCANVVKNRVNRENSYIRILMVQKSNQLLDQTTKAYTQKHFVEEKLMGLRSIIAKVKDMFQTIVKQAPVSRSCSK